MAPFENPALASGGTGDVLSGTIGSLLAQGLAPFAAARARRLPARPRRRGGLGSGSATPDCSPRTCPTRSPSRAAGWRRFADARRAAGVGFGSREAAAGDRPAERGRPRRRPSDLARRACRRCRAPRGSRSISIGSSATCARSARPCPPASASSPSSRPTPTATARCRSRARSRLPAPTACASPRSTRRWSCGAAASGCPSSSSIRSRPAWRRGGRGLRHQRSRSATRRSWRGRSTRGCARDAGRRRPTGATAARSSSRSRRASVAAASRVGALRAPPSRRSGRPRAWTSRALVAPRQPRRSRSHRGPARGVRRGAAAAVLGGGRTVVRRRTPSRRERRHPRGCRRRLRRPSGPGSRSYGVAARGARRRARARSALAAALRPVMSLHARPVRVVGPAGRHGRLLRRRLRHGPPEPDRDAARRLRATATSALRTNRVEALVRGHLVPLVGTDRDGRRHGRRHRRPRVGRSTSTTSSSCSGDQGDQDPHCCGTGA